MKSVSIKVISQAKENKIVPCKNNFKVYVTAPAIKGKANKAVIKLLAKFFKIKKSCLKIIKGEKSKEKIIGIINNKSQKDKENILKKRNEK